MASGDTTPGSCFYNVNKIDGTLPQGREEIPGFIIHVEPLAGLRCDCGPERALPCNITSVLDCTTARSQQAPWWLQLCEKRDRNMRVPTRPRPRNLQPRRHVRHCKRQACMCSCPPPPFCGLPDSLHASCNVHWSLQRGLGLGQFAVRASSTGRHQLELEPPLHASPSSQWPRATGHDPELTWPCLMFLSTTQGVSFCSA